MANQSADLLFLVMLGEQSTAFPKEKRTACDHLTQDLAF